jgi:hypothetical protein
MLNDALIGGGPEQMAAKADPVRFYAMFVYFLACFIQVRGEGHQPSFAR